MNDLAKKIVDFIVPLDYPERNRTAATEYVRDQINIKATYVLMADGHPVPLGVFFKWEDAANAATKAGQGLYLVIEYAGGVVGKKDLNQLFID